MPPQATLSTKIKVQLKLSIARLKLVQQRDAALAKASRRSMAQLLEQGKTDSARIRVESIIRSDITIELYEMLELYCELLLARAGLLDAGGNVCDPGLEEAVKSIMYAAPKSEVKELHTLRTLFGEKFGKEFLGSVMEGTKGGVSDKVVRKLEVKPPREELVQGYLEEIARAYGVDWSGGKGVANQLPDEVEELDLLDMGDDGVGGDGEGGSALKDLELLEGSQPDISKADEAETNYPKETTAAEWKGSSQSTTPVAKTMKTGSSAGSASGASARKPPDVPAHKTFPKGTEMRPMRKAEGPKKEEPPSSGIPDLSELERRFAALKKLG